MIYRQMEAGCKNGHNPVATVIQIIYYHCSTSSFSVCSSTYFWADETGKKGYLCTQTMLATAKAMMPSYSMIILSFMLAGLFTNLTVHWQKKQLMTFPCLSIAKDYPDPLNSLVQVSIMQHSKQEEARPIPKATPEADNREYPYLHKTNTSRLLAAISKQIPIVATLAFDLILSQTFPQIHPPRMLPTPKKTKAIPKRMSLALMSVWLRWGRRWERELAANPDTVPIRIEIGKKCLIFTACFRQSFMHAQVELSLVYRILSSKVSSDYWRWAAFKSIGEMNRAGQGIANRAKNERIKKNILSLPQPSPKIVRRGPIMTLTLMMALERLKRYPLKSGLTLGEQQERKRPQIIHKKVEAPPPIILATTSRIVLQSEGGCISTPYEMFSVESRPGRNTLIKYPIAQMVNHWLAVRVLERMIEGAKKERKRKVRELAVRFISPQPRWWSFWWMQMMIMLKEEQVRVRRSMKMDRITRGRRT